MGAILDAATVGSTSVSPPMTLRSGGVFFALLPFAILVGLSAANSFVAGLIAGSLGGLGFVERNTVHRRRAAVLAVENVPSKGSRVVGLRAGPAIAVHHRKAISKDVDSS